jgi:hypothetical protein
LPETLVLSQKLPAVLDNHGFLGMIQHELCLLRKDRQEIALCQIVAKASSKNISGVSVFCMPGGIVRKSSRYFLSANLLGILDLRKRVHVVRTQAGIQKVIVALIPQPDYTTSFNAILFVPQSLKQKLLEPAERPLLLLDRSHESSS